MTKDEDELPRRRLDAPVAPGRNPHVGRKLYGPYPLIGQCRRRRSVHGHRVDAVADEDHLDVDVLLCQRGGDGPLQFHRPVPHGQYDDRELHLSLLEATTLTKCSTVCTPATTATATVSTRVAPSPPTARSRRAASRISRDSSTAPMIRWKRSAATARRAIARPDERGRAARSPPAGPAGEARLAPRHTTVAVSALSPAARGAARRAR